MNISEKIKAIFKKIFSSHESYYHDEPNKNKGSSYGDNELTKLNTHNRHDFFNS